MAGGLQRTPCCQLSKKGPRYVPITFALSMLIGVVQRNITVRDDVKDATAKGAYPSQKKPC